jgi:translation initiation factor 2 beta subunit (eIF-2beta)/eIF-5
MAAKPESACKHPRTRLIARDADAQYVECLDCGEILEAGELKTGESKEGPGFDESLSDA